MADAASKVPPKDVELSDQTPDKAGSDDGGFHKKEDAKKVPAAAAQGLCVDGDAYVKSLLQKWGLYDRLQLLTFSYTRHYTRLQGAELVHDLLADPEFQQHFKVVVLSSCNDSLLPELADFASSACAQVTAKGDSGLNQPLQGRPSCIQTQHVPATETRLDMFDHLLTADPPIVRGKGGDLIKCFGDQRGGYEVSDMLRQMLLCEESDHANLFSIEEKQQLLWRLFQLLCLGGACCQWEDSLEPYLELTKRLYKSLLSVHKSPNTGKVEVRSTVLEVTGWQAETGLPPLFPCAGARSNLCMVAIDPLQRVVKVLYHAFVPYW